MIEKILKLTIIIWFLLRKDKRCRVAYGLKKNENKGNVQLTLSQKKTQQSEN